MKSEMKHDVERYLAGDMPPDETNALLETIRKNPEDLRYLGKALEQQALLHEILAGAKTAERNASAPDLTVLAGTTRPSTDWFRWIYIAAAFWLITVAGYNLLTTRETLQPVTAPTIQTLATIEFALPGAAIVRTGKEIPVKTGDSIINGDVVKNTSNTRLNLRYKDDATTVEFPNAANVAFSVVDGAKNIAIKEGAINCDVAKQPAGKPMRIKTDQAEITVIGTRLTVQIISQHTMVTVQEGAVKASRSPATSAIDVRAGQFAVVGADLDLAAWRFESARSTNKILFIDEFSGNPASVCSFTDLAHNLTDAEWGGKKRKILTLTPEASKCGSLDIKIPVTNGFYVAEWDMSLDDIHSQASKLILSSVLLYPDEQPRNEKTICLSYSNVGMKTPYRYRLESEWRIENGTNYQRSSLFRNGAPIIFSTGEYKPMPFFSMLISNCTVSIANMEIRRVD